MDRNTWKSWKMYSFVYKLDRRFLLFYVELKNAKIDKLR